MGRTKVAKVTISLPKELLELTDRLARERDVTRSGLIAELLEKEEEARITALMAEGYQEMAEENHSLAEESFPMVSETISRSTNWGRGANG